MDKELISLLVFGAIALISTWLNKKRQERAEQKQPPPSLGERDATEAPPPRRSSNWEEELRRLLEGESPASPPPRPEPIHRPAPVVPPALPGRTSVPPVMAAPPQPVHAAQVRPPMPVVPSTAVLLQQAHVQQEEARRTLAHAEEQSVLQHSHLPTAVPPVSGAHVRKLLHDRESLRSAFVVSLIFGTPKGLGDQ